MMTEPQRTLILHPYLKNPKEADNRSTRTLQGCLEEAEGLAEAIDLEVVEVIAVPLERPTPSTYIGSGKVDEIKLQVKSDGVDLVIVDMAISPVQQRNLEKAWQCKVIDRTALILEIFGERARTKEGQLQVELAAFEYQKSRLVRSWTHLERQRGGGGFMGGPGETQIEADRRAIHERIGQIRKQLKKVVQTRELHRKSRRKVPYPIVALVGYTNAGKSTLFNHLTKAEVYAEDKLFATLDPTMRQVSLPSGQQVILSDTVGFISNLPTELVAAFRATLEEVIEADVILHVRDISHIDSKEQKDDVLTVLGSLVPEEKISHDTIEVLNKTDLLTEEGKQQLKSRAEKSQGLVAISAKTSDGMNTLFEAIEKKLASGKIDVSLMLDMTQGHVLAWVHRHAQVLEQKDEDDYIRLSIRLPEKEWGRLQKMLST
jgi:GTP-binding protein HflX